MLLEIIIAWLVVNALLVAFLLLHPLRHFSSGARGSAPPPPASAESPSPRSLA